MGLFRALFLKHKVLVSETMGYKNYMKAAQRLNQNRISFETVIKGQNNSIGNAMQDAMDETRRSLYCIYVKREDKHRVIQILE